MYNTLSRCILTLPHNYEYNSEWKLEKKTNSKIKQFFYIGWGTEVIDSNGEISSENEGSKEAAIPLQISMGDLVK